jgi:diaminohydroxyphosphoribosylaminopyrimidine deaminase/5-amino-6-(5-phosphoribosylamino)uracil reductase
MVGALVVRGGVVVGEGFHARFGEAHAEAVAVRAAGPAAAGATLYVTLEPCTHAGKTPPCTETVIDAGVRRVVVAVADPNPTARGGAERLRRAGLDVRVGVCEEDARELNAPFFHAFTSNRPWTTLKLAVSLDGAIADAARGPGWVSSDASRAAVHRFRAGHDAIAVGMGTVLADDPQLTVRDVTPPRRPPLRVVFSRTGRLPLTSRLAQSVDEARVLVFAEMIDPAYEHQLNELGVEVAPSPSLADAMRLLAARGVQSLLVEGGATLAGALLSDRLVDRLLLIEAPIILGGGALPAFGAMPAVRVADARRLRVVRREEVGGDLATLFALDAR